jgi:hypothetical protein
VPEVVSCINPDVYRVIKARKYEPSDPTDQKAHLCDIFSLLEYVLLFLKVHGPQELYNPYHEALIFVLEEAYAFYNLAMYGHSQLHPQLIGQFIHEKVKVLQLLQVVVIYGPNKFLEQNRIKVILCVNV